MADKPALISTEKFISTLKEKLKTEFINLIPEDEWDQLIKTTIKDFQEKELKTVLKTELTKIIQEILNKNLDTITNVVWDPTKQGNSINRELKDMILSMAPEILANMIGGQISNAFASIRNNQPYQNY